MSRFHAHDWDFLPEQAFQPQYRGGPMRLHGGKGSSAPPPDPRLVEAQMRSMGIQDSAIQQVMANANSMAPIQREQMQFGLDSARTAYKQSQDDRTWMLGRRGALSGLQDTIVSDAKNFDVAGRTDQMLGEAQADLSSAYSSSMDQNLRGLTRRGGNVSGATMAALGSENAVRMAAASAGVSAKVRQAAKAEGLALTDRASNALAGYPAMGMAATGAGAGFGASTLGLANSGAAGLNAGFNTAGGMAGQMGSNAAGMYGAMGSYKNGADQIAASNDPFNTILGAAAGIGTKWALGKV